MRMTALCYQLGYWKSIGYFWQRAQHKSQQQPVWEVRSHRKEHCTHGGVTTSSYINNI